MPYDEYGDWYEDDFMLDASDEAISEMDNTAQEVESYRLNNPPPSWSNRETQFSDDKGVVYQNLNNPPAYDVGGYPIRQAPPSNEAPIELYGLGKNVMYQKPGDVPRDSWGDEMPMEAFGQLKDDIGTYDVEEAYGAPQGKLDEIAGIKPPPTDTELGFFNRKQAAIKELMPKWEEEARADAEQAGKDLERIIGNPANRAMFTPAEAAQYETAINKEKMEKYQKSIEQKLRMFDKAADREINLEIAKEKYEQQRKDRSTFDPETIKLEGIKYATTGKMPALGMGNAPMRAAIMQAAKDYFVSQGIDPETVPSLQAEFAGTQKGLSMSLGQQEKQRGLAGSFVRNLDKQVNRVDGIMSDLVDRVGVRAVDLPLRELKMRVMGSGQEQVVNAYLTEISNEIAKLSTGSQASIAELSVEAQKRWAKIHDPSLSISEIKKILEETKAMGKMRIDSMDEELKTTQTSIKNKRFGVVGDRDSNTNQQKTVVERRRLPNGKIGVKYSDGSKGYE